MDMRRQNGTEWEDLGMMNTSKEEGKMENGPLPRHLPGNNNATTVTVHMAFYEYGWDGQLIR